MTESIAQGSGKVMLRADINALNSNKDMQVSVIDLTTKDVIQRDEVSNRFFSTLPLDGRFMVYFKKSGHPSTRMIVDTHNVNAASYHICFSLNLKNLSSEMETGISMSIGTLKFNQGLSNFEFHSATETTAGLMAVTYSGLDRGIAEF